MYTAKYLEEITEYNFTNFAVVEVSYLDDESQDVDLNTNLYITRAYVS